MTESYDACVRAFEANLTFQAPYAEEIRRFLYDVILRIGSGKTLLPAQSDLLLIDDPATIATVVGEWADTVEASAARLRQVLASADVFTAVRYALAWPDGQARLYETVLDIYRFEGNPLLRNPYEASERPRAILKAAFPVNVNAEDPLGGRADEFADQLARLGNPWR